MLSSRSERESIENPNIQKRSKNKNQEIRCAYCGSRTTLVWVHGHGQCSRCGVNIDECCRGEHGTDSY